VALQRAGRAASPPPLFHCLSCLLLLASALGVRGTALASRAGPLARRRGYRSQERKSEAEEIKGEKRESREASTVTRSHAANSRSHYTALNRGRRRHEGDASVNHSRVVTSRGRASASNFCKFPKRFVARLASPLRDSTFDVSGAVAINLVEGIALLIAPIVSLRFKGVQR